MNLINKILIVVITIIAIYAVFLMYSDLNLVKDHFGKFNIEFLPQILGLVVLGWFVLFYRWVLLLKKSDIDIPKLSNFYILMSGLALSIVPGKIGELIKSQLLKTKYNIPRTKTAPIIIVEQLNNLLGIITVSCVGLGIMGLFNIKFFDISNYVIISATIVLITILIIVNSKKIFRKIFLKISKFRFISKYELSVDSSYDILKNSLSGKFMISSIALSSLFWIIEGLIVYSVLLAFNIETLVFMTTITTYTSSILLGFISFLPMGIGVTEGTLTGFLSLQGIEISLAATIVVFIRIFTRWLGVGIGFIFLKMAGGFSSNNEKIE